MKEEKKYFLLWQHLKSVVKIIALLGNSVQMYNQLVISFDTLNSNIADVGTIIRCPCLLALICCYVIPTCKKTPCLGWNGDFPLGEEVSDRQVFIFCCPAYLQKNSFFNENSRATTGNFFAQLLAYLSLPCAVSPNSVYHTTAEILGSFSRYV